MKTLVVILFLALASCGRESSPEGRSKIRDEKIQEQLDVLKMQNKAIMDSIATLSRQLNQLKLQPKPTK